MFEWPNWTAEEWKQRIKAIHDPKLKTEDHAASVKAWDTRGRKSDDTWTKVGHQMGSNEGGVYEDANGQKFYVKFYQDMDQGRTEVLANSIYKELGIPAPESSIQNVNGKEAVASKMLPNPQALNTKEMTASPDVQAGFAADAYLANHDVIGLVQDNIVRSNGRDYRIDNGGTLFHRAQGAHKTFFEKNKTNVPELESMRNPNVAHEAGAVFQNLSTPVVRTQASVLAMKLTDAKLKSMVSAAGFTGTKGEKYLGYLVGRRDAMARYGAGSNEAWDLDDWLEEMDAIEFLNEGGTGSGNHGHSGRPGEVGGSGPGGGTAQVNISEPSISYKTASWSDVPTNIKDKVLNHWLEDEAYGNAADNIDYNDLDREFEKELRDNNEDVVKATENQTISDLSQAFPNPNPGLPLDQGQEISTYKKLDPESLVYDEDSGDGAQLDLGELRFTDGSTLSDEEKSIVEHAWNKNYDLEFQAEMDRIRDGNTYIDRRDSLERQYIDDAWLNMHDSKKLAMAYSLGYGDADFDLSPRPQPVKAFQATAAKPAAPPQNTEYEKMPPPAEKLSLISDTNQITDVSRTSAGSSSDVQKVTFSNGARAIFKPTTGETTSFEYDRGIGGGGEQGKREAASWEMANALGVDDIVAPSLFTSVKGKDGSLQYWSSGTLGMNFSSTSIPKEDGIRAAAFDYLTGQTDRHGRNWLYDPDHKQLTLIDNGLSFPTRKAADFWNSSFLVPAAESKYAIPESIKVKLTPENLSATKTRLTKYLNTDALTLLEGRWNKMVNAKTFDDLNVVEGAKYYRFTKAANPGNPFD